MKGTWTSRLGSGGRLFLALVPDEDATGPESALPEGGFDVLQGAPRQLGEEAQDEEERHTLNPAYIHIVGPGPIALMVESRVRVMITFDPQSVAACALVPAPRTPRG